MGKPYVERKRAASGLCFLERFESFLIAVTHFFLHTVVTAGTLILGKI